MSMLKQKRILKISYQPGHPERPMPRIQGLWLLEAQFEIGDLIQVCIKPRFLTITKSVKERLATNGREQLSHSKRKQPCLRLILQCN